MNSTFDGSREAVSAVSFTAKQIATGGLSMVRACTVYAFACTLPCVVLLSSISRCCDAMHFLEYSQYLSSSCDGNTEEGEQVL